MGGAVGGRHVTRVTVAVRPVGIVVMMVVMVAVVDAVGCCVAVVVLLPLAVLLVLHAPVLEPNFHLALRQVQISRQFPAFLFGHVGVEQELLLQLQRLEFRVRLPLLPHRHLARPLQRIRTQRTCSSGQK